MPVEKNEEDGKWTAVCDRPGCGGFASTGHETKKVASERLAAHHLEHDAGIEAELQTIIEEGN